MHQSLESRRDLNFIGSTCRPVTTKSPLIIRMVSVVIGALAQSSSAALSVPSRKFRLA